MATGQQRGSERDTADTHRESALSGGTRDDRLERLAERHGGGRMKAEDLIEKGYQEAAQLVRVPYATQGQEQMGRCRGPERDTSVDQGIDTDESTG